MVAILSNVPEFLPKITVEFIEKRGILPKRSRKNCFLLSNQGLEWVEQRSPYP